MNEDVKNQERENEIYFRLKAKKVPKVKAGAELGSIKKVRFVEVEIDEITTETSEELHIDLHIKDRVVEDSDWQKN